MTCEREAALCSLLAIMVSLCCRCCGWRSSLVQVQGRKERNVARNAAAINLPREWMAGTFSFCLRERGGGEARPAALCCQMAARGPVATAPRAGRRREKEGGQSEPPRPTRLPSVGLRV